MSNLPLDPPRLKDPKMNKSAKNLTLPEAIEIERTSPAEEQVLYAPRLDQPPPSKTILNSSIPKGAIIRQPPHPQQKPLALKAVERCPNKGEQQAFDQIWAELDAKAAAEKALEVKNRAAQEAIEAEHRATAEALAAKHRAAEEAIKADNRYWGFAQSPESIAQQNPLPEGVYRLDDVIKEAWCQPPYKSKAALIRYLLQPQGYPARLIARGLLARVGYDILVARRLKARRQKDRGRKETAAAKQATDQVPEPIYGSLSSSPPSLSKPHQVKSLAENQGSKKTAFGKFEVRKRQLSENKGFSGTL
jgi:hypothetical protein